MATVLKKNLGDNQYGGAIPAGNVTTYRAKLETNAIGAALESDSAVALAIADVVILQKLPEGMLLEDSLVIVSTTFSASVTASLGFKYVDGVDSVEVPQDAAYFGAGLVLSSAAVLRNAVAKAPLRLPKEAYLTLTIAGAANAKASRLDVIVHGERFGPK